MAKDEDKREFSLETFRPTAPIHIRSERPVGKPPADTTPVDIGGGPIVVAKKPEPEKK
jgi:hypothetical protein